MRIICVIGLAVVIVACTGDDADAPVPITALTERSIDEPDTAESAADPEAPSAADTEAPAPTTTVAETTSTTTTLPEGVTPPPAWIGTRILPLRDDGFG